MTLQLELETILCPEELFLEERVLLNHKLGHCDSLLALFLHFKLPFHCLDVSVALL